MIDVGNGWYGLHLYANENWVEHFLQHADALNGVEGHSVSTSLLAQVTKLCSVQSGLMDDEERAEQTRASQSYVALPDSRSRTYGFTKGLAAL